MSGIFDSMRRSFSGGDDVEQAEQDSDTKNMFSGDFKKITNLSLKQKIIGFIICVSLAAFFAILGCALAFIGGTAGGALFAVLFFLGTLFGVCSTFFLLNPIQQAKKIYDPGNPIGMAIKIICIVLVVLMVALIFCAVFWWGVPGLGIFFCIVEFVALVVYAVLLIPFATTIISRGIKTAVSSS